MPDDPVIKQGSTLVLAEAPLASINDLTCSAQVMTIDEFRHELRNFQQRLAQGIQNGEIKLVADVQLQNNPQLQMRMPLEAATFYYQNPNRAYDINLDQRIKQYENAAAIAANLQRGFLDNDAKPFTLQERTAVLKMLRTAEPQELAAAKEIYREVFGRDLAQDLRHSMRNDPPRLEQLERVLEGDKTKCYLSELKSLMAEPERNRHAIHTLLTELDKDSMESLKQAYKTSTGQDLSADLKKASPELNLEKMFSPEAIKSHEISKTLEALKLAPEMLVRYLRELPPKNLKLVELNRIPDPALKEIAKAYIEGNRPLAEALYLEREIKNVTLNPIKLEASFKGLDPSQKVIVQEILASRGTGEIQNHLNPVTPVEKAAYKQVIETGRIEEPTRVLLLSQTPSEAKNLINILEQKTQQEMNLIKQEIVRVYNTNIDQQLAHTLKGREQFEARLSLFGKPDTLEDELLRSRAQYEFERIYSPVKFDRLMKGLKKAGKRSDRNMKKLEDMHDKISRKKEYLEEREELSFYSLLGIFDRSLLDYRIAKERYNTALENIVGLFTGLTTYLVAKDFSPSVALTGTLSASTFLCAKISARRYIEETAAIEKSLSNFRDRRRKRGKSHRTRRGTGGRRR